MCVHVGLQPGPKWSNVGAGRGAFATASGIREGAGLGCVCVCLCPAWPRAILPCTLPSPDLWHIQEEQAPPVPILALGRCQCPACPFWHSVDRLPHQDPSFWVSLPQPRDLFQPCFSDSCRWSGMSAWGGNGGERGDAHGLPVQLHSRIASGVGSPRGLWEAQKLSLPAGFEQWEPRLCPPPKWQTLCSF